jgi:hypothetical protein
MLAIRRLSLDVNQKHGSASQAKRTRSDEARARPDEAKNPVITPFHPYKQCNLAIDLDTVFLFERRIRPTAVLRKAIF